MLKSSWYSTFSCITSFALRPNHSGNQISIFHLEHLIESKHRLSSSFIHQVIKSVHKARNPEEHESRKTSIVHSTIDWSKYPPSAYRKRSQVRPPMQVDQDDGTVDQSEREGNCSQK